MDAMPDQIAPNGHGDSDSRRDESLREISEKLENVERQLDQIRLELFRLNQTRRARIGHFWRRALRSRLFCFHHYEPRLLEFPNRYRAEKADQNAPQIAVVTTVYNQAEFLKATIESVLDQNYPRLSYFIKDAGSTDGTLDVLKSFGDRVDWKSAPDSGLSSGLNQAFRQVNGEIMAYLNGDDLLTPGTLSYVAKAFQANPDIDVFYGHRIVIDRNDHEIGRWVLPQHDAEAIKWADYIPQETMFWRRRVWDAIGPFDEDLQFAVDWDFILRAHRSGFRFKRLPRFLGCFRVHEKQKTTAEFDIGEFEARELRKVHLGFDPPQSKINEALRPYVRRHIIAYRLYKFPIIKSQY